MTNDQYNSLMNLYGAWFNGMFLVAITVVITGALVIAAYALWRNR